MTPKRPCSTVRHEVVLASYSVQPLHTNRPTQARPPHIRALFLRGKNMKISFKGPETEGPFQVHKLFFASDPPAPRRLGGGAFVAT